DLASCEGECEVDTGRRIGADVVVSGELLKFGTQYKLNMKLHDTRSGELIAGAVAAGTTADDLDRSVAQACEKLFAPLKSGALARVPVGRLWLAGGLGSAVLREENGWSAMVEADYPVWKAVAAHIQLLAAHGAVGIGLTSGDDALYVATAGLSLVF